MGSHRVGHNCSDLAAAAERIRMTRCSRPRDRGKDIKKGPMRKEPEQLVTLDPEGEGGVEESVLPPTSSFSSMKYCKHLDT